MQNVDFPDKLYICGQMLMSMLCTGVMKIRELVAYAYMYSLSGKIYILYFSIDEKFILRLIHILINNSTQDYNVLYIIVFKC